MSTNKIPCVDCITLSICKAVIEEAKYDYLNDRGHNLSGVFINEAIIKLANRCSLIRPLCTVKNFNYWYDISNVIKFLL